MRRIEALISDGLIYILILISVLTLVYLAAGVLHCVSDRLSGSEDAMRVLAYRAPPERPVQDIPEPVKDYRLLGRLGTLTALGVALWMAWRVLSAFYPEATWGALTEQDRASIQRPTSGIGQEERPESQGPVLIGKLRSSRDVARSRSGSRARR